MIDIDEYKEVLEALKSGFLDTADLEPYMQIIYNALEKQIPKKVKHKTTRFVIQGFELNDDCIHCPLCDKFMGNLSAEHDFNRISDYCPDCGQALDWSGENE